MHQNIKGVHNIQIMTQQKNIASFIDFRYYPCEQIRICIVIYSKLVQINRKTVTHFIYRQNFFKPCLWFYDSIIKLFLIDLNMLSSVSKSVKSIIYNALSLIALLARKLYNALSKKHLRPCTHTICYTTIITSYFLSIFGYHNHYDLTLILDKFGVLPKRFMFMNE